VQNSDLPRIRLHDLRHTHALIAVKAGMPIGVVSERLGHASPEFTLHRYSHVMPGMQREAANTIARAGQVRRCVNKSRIPLLLSISLSAEERRKVLN
jgi:integrase